MKHEFDQVANVLTDVVKVITTNELQERIIASIDVLRSLEKKVQAVVQENGSLQERLADAVKRAQTAESKIAAQPAPNDFVEYRGALFKRRDGKLDPDAYCPQCEIPMTSLMGDVPFRCSRCKTTVNFTGRDLNRFIHEIPH